MSLEVLSAPAYEPVSLAEARKWLRLEDDDTVNDVVLRLLVKAMREDAENLTFRAFISRQYRLNLTCWPTASEYGYAIELPFPPLISVDSVKYLDTDGVLTTLATDQYDVHDEAEPAFIIPAHQVTWPTVRRRPNGVQVVFTAGYPVGSPSDEAGAQQNLPAALRLWMESKMATHHEFREMLISGTIVSKIPRDFTDGLLDPLVVGNRLF